jgi:hypothetical protein
MTKIRAAVLDDNAENLEKRNLDDPLPPLSVQHSRRVLLVGLVQGLVDFFRYARGEKPICLWKARLK